MRKINVEKYGLNTPVHIELTIGELLNIAYAVSHTIPCVAGERIMSVLGFSSADKQEIIGNQPDPLVYQVATQCRQILAEYGYEYNWDKYEYE